MICVGDRLAAKPFTSDKIMTGRVVYVHPSQRWYTLEFMTEIMGKRGKYARRSLQRSRVHPCQKDPIHEKRGGDAA